MTSLVLLSGDNRRKITKKPAAKIAAKKPAGSIASRWDSAASKIRGNLEKLTLKGEEALFGRSFVERQTSKVANVTHKVLNTGRAIEAAKKGDITRLTQETGTAGFLDRQTAALKDAIGGAPSSSSSKLPFGGLSGYVMVGGGLLLVVGAAFLLTGRSE